jgi:uncharacterized caspase-like protein
MVDLCKLWLLVLVSCCLGCGPAMAEKRVALVIGNGAYASAPRLPNPSHDAEDVAAALKRSNFEVIFGADVRQSEMQEAAIRFARAANDADVAVFYYSGHAMQFGGVNYLMPIDAKLDDEADLRRFTRVDDILSDLQQAKNLRILVLDSCRDNPLAENLKRSIGQTRGLAMPRGLSKMEAPRGTIVSFSTQAGQTADDGQGRNSPYTTAFLKHIEEPHEIGDVFRDISSDVYQASGKAQLPELSLSIVGRFYLNGPLAVTINPPASSPPLDPCAASEAHWKAANAIATTAAYEDHLARFPTCAFANLAKAQLEDLRRQTALKTPSDPVSKAAGRNRDFDGSWDVTVSCANSGSVKGYVRSLSATVTDGAFHAEDKSSGKPNWLLIDGDIAPDGKATFTAKGLTGDAAYSVGGIKSGSAYSYTIDAKFERSRGTGKRNELRPCTLTFAKR